MSKYHEQRARLAAFKPPTDEEIREDLKKMYLMSIASLFAKVEKGDFGAFQYFLHAAKGLRELVGTDAPSRQVHTLNTENFTATLDISGGKKK